MKESDEELFVWDIICGSEGAFSQVWENHQLPPGDLNKQLVSQTGGVVFRGWRLDDLVEMRSVVLTRLLEQHIGASRVAGFSLSFVDVSFQVADHVRLAGDGDRTHNTVVVSHVSPRSLEEIKQPIFQDFVCDTLFYGSCSFLKATSVKWRITTVW